MYRQHPCNNHRLGYDSYGDVTSAVDGLHCSVRITSRLGVLDQLGYMAWKMGLGRSIAHFMCESRPIDQEQAEKYGVIQSLRRGVGVCIYE